MLSRHLEQHCRCSCCCGAYPDMKRVTGQVHAVHIVDPLRDDMHGASNMLTCSSLLQVTQGGVESVTVAPPPHTLLLCYPPSDSSMASDCLKAYRQAL